VGGREWAVALQTGASIGAILAGMESNSHPTWVGGVPNGRPRLRALPGGDPDGWASGSDREMIERTCAGLELFTAKWKVDILYLLAAGLRRHSHLYDHLVVSKKVLTEALRALERDGLVRRRVCAEMPVRVEYSLTPLGRSLTGPLFALYEWADTQFESVRAARRAYDSPGGECADVEDEPARLRFTAAFRARP
jgi:DNA-binding HxlR family transcriptional regulator